MKTEMINHSFLSLSQDPSIHFLMTRFRHIPKSNYYWRSSVDNSSPSHQTLCWGTGERWVFLCPVEYSYLSNSTRPSLPPSENSTSDLWSRAHSSSSTWMFCLVSSVSIPLVDLQYLCLCYCPACPLLSDHWPFCGGGDHWASSWLL